MDALRITQCFLNDRGQPIRRRGRSRLPGSAQYGAWLGRQFAEYFEPYTADPLGSLRQSWTAAVALDWLANSASL